MNHPERRWTVKTVLNGFQLTSKVKAESRPQCKGFRLRKYLFLPDDDLGQGNEGTFVVVKEPALPCELFREVWQGVFPTGSPESVGDFIRSIVNGEIDNREQAQDLEFPPTLDPPEAHEQCTTHCVLEG